MLLDIAVGVLVIRARAYASVKPSERDQISHLGSRHRDFGNRRASGGESLVPLSGLAQKRL